MSAEDPKRRFRPGGAARHRTLSRGIDGDKIDPFPRSRGRHRQLGGWRRLPASVVWMPGDNRAYWWNSMGVIPRSAHQSDYALIR